MIFLKLIFFLKKKIKIKNFCLNNSIFFFFYKIYLIMDPSVIKFVLVGDEKVGKTAIILR